MSSKLKDLIKNSIKEYLDANEITVKDAVRGKIREQISESLGQVSEINDDVVEQIKTLVKKHITDMQENSQITLRKEKLQTLAEQNNGISHPNSFRRNVVAHALQNQYAQYSKQELEELEDKKQYNITGRVVLRRVMGKASFITLQDYSGRIQVYLKRVIYQKGNMKLLRIYVI